MTSTVQRDESSSTSSKRRLYVVGAGVVLVIAAVQFVRGQIARLPDLRTVNIERRELRVTVGTSGTIEPEEVVEVGARVAGMIVQVGPDPKMPDKPVDVGTVVTRGDVLAQLETELYSVEKRKADAAVKLAEAEVGRLRTQLQQAQKTLDRARKLRDTNSESDFDRILAAHDMAKWGLATGLARLSQAQAEARQAEINLERTTIRSPIDGVIIDRRVNQGQRVSPATPGIFLIARDLRKMRVRASVSETDIGKVFVGQPVTFQVDAYRERTFQGRVEKIQLNARAEGNFVSYDVLIAIRPGIAKLFPQMSANVELEVVRRENACLVPSGALDWKPRKDQIDPSVVNTRQIAANDKSAIIWVPAGKGYVRPMKVQRGINDGALTEVQGAGVREDLPVVVGNVKRTVLARIIPSVKTVR